MSCSNSDDCPDFYKIYLPEHNSQRLRIPPAFIKNFNGNIPTKSMIKNTSGKFWRVELERDGLDLFIMKGWEGFVNDNSLERGDFLILSYKGNSLFFVKVFGVNGCMKEEPVVRLSNISCANIEKEGRGEQDFSLRTPSCKEENLGKGIGVSKSLPGSPLEGKSKAKTVDLLDNPRFIQTFNESIKNSMHIPIEVIQQCNIKSAENTILYNQNGVVQPVKIRMWNHQYVLTGGLKEFWIKSNIKHGDQCEFEIILGRGRKIRKMLVQISHRSTRNLKPGGRQPRDEEVQLQ
ncbi:hypothetical protein Ancab_026054 [Ancistrocladus abbreviatus]